MRLKIKLTPNTPKTDSGLTQMIMMGKSIRQIWVKGMDSESHKTPYVYVKYHYKFIPGTRECISGLLRKILVFKVGKPSFFPASE